MACDSVLTAAEFINGALHYDPPSILYPVELNNDPGDNPFSGDGRGIEFLSQTDAYRDFGSVRFQFAMIGFTVGNGKHVTYSTITTNELRRIFEELWTKGGGTNGSVRMTNVGGLPAVSARGAAKSPQTRMYEATWVQVKTNIVLRIIVTAQNHPMFDTLTASLKTVKVDSDNYFASMQPKPPKVTQLQVTNIQTGFAPLYGRTQVPAFVFHTKTGLWSIVSADHGFPEVEKELFSSLGQVLDNLSKQSLSGVRCRVTIDISRYGRGSDEIQRTAGFHVVVDGVNPLRSDSHQKLEGDQPFGLSSISDKGAPEGFRKVRELKINMELVIENNDTN